MKSSRSSIRNNSPRLSAIAIATASGLLLTGCGPGDDFRLLVDQGCAVIKSSDLNPKVIFSYPIEAELDESADVSRQIIQSDLSFTVEPIDPQEVPAIKLMASLPGGFVERIVQQLDETIWDFLVDGGPFGDYGDAAPSLSEARAATGLIPIAGPKLLESSEGMFTIEFDYFDLLDEVSEALGLVGEEVSDLPGYVEVAEGDELGFTIFNHYAASLAHTPLAVVASCNDEAVAAFLGTDDNNRLYLSDTSVQHFYPGFREDLLDVEIFSVAASATSGPSTQITFSSPDSDAPEGGSDSRFPVHAFLLPVFEGDAFLPAADFTDLPIQDKFWLTRVLQLELDVEFGEETAFGLHPLHTMFTELTFNNLVLQPDELFPRRSLEVTVERDLSPEGLANRYEALLPAFLDALLEGIRANLEEGGGVVTDQEILDDFVRQFDVLPAEWPTPEFSEVLVYAVYLDPVGFDPDIFGLAENDPQNEDNFDIVLELSYGLELITLSEIAPVIEGGAASFAGPIINSVTPSAAAPGQTVVLTGANLGAVTSVTIDGMAAGITAVSASALTMRLPLGLEAGVKDLVLRSPQGIVRSQGLLRITSAVDVAARGWMRNLGDGTVKMYARDLLGAGKVQLYHNGVEVAWARAVDGLDPKLNVGANGSRDGIVRTRTLVPGKNVFEIWVAGERVRRAAYAG